VPNPKNPAVVIRLCEGCYNAIGEAYAEANELMTDDQAEERMADRAAERMEGRER
jgi:hypothetical protein